MRSAVIAFCAASLLSTAAVAEKTLADFPFWKANVGWWRAENTYLDHNLDYNIRSYNSVIHVEIDGRKFRETEIKSYAPSKLALGYGRGKTTKDEGVETITVLTGELIDDKGTVRLTGEEVTEIRLLTDDTGVRVTPNHKTGTDTYRMFIFLPTPEKRYRSNFGLVSDTTGAGAANAAADAKLGDLRGFSLFREDRIQASEADKWRAEFRARNKVKAVLENGQVTRLPD